MKRFDTFFFERKSWNKLLQLGRVSFPVIKSYFFSNTLTTGDKPMVDILKQRVFLKLIETKSFSSDTVQLIYHV